MLALAQLDQWRQAGEDHERRDLAHTRIRQFFQAGLQGVGISLNHLGLNALPDNLAELIPSVRRLALAGNYLTSLRPLDNLNALEELDVSDNELETLADLPSLPNLQRLTAFDNPGAYSGQLDLRAHFNLRQVLPVEAVRAGQLDRLEADFHPVAVALSAWCRAAPDEQRLLARDRIRQFFDKDDMSATLSLCNLNLSALPRGFARMVPNVELMDLHSNALSSLAELRGLDCLQMLRVHDNQMASFDSLPDLGLLRGLKVDGNCFPTGEELNLSRFPAIVWVFPPTLVRADQRHQLRELPDGGEVSDDDVSENSSDDISEVSFDDSDESSSDAGSEANLAEDADYQSPLVEAATRWGQEGDIKGAMTLAAEFYRSVMPPTLHHVLRERVEARSLLTLCTGLAFVADNDVPTAAQALRAGIKADLEYLLRHLNGPLMGACMEVAEAAVGRCGDRVSHGRVQLHMQIEKHQMIAENWPIKRVFSTFDQHYNQSLVEMQAAKYSTGTTSKESIETYQLLAKRVQSLLSAPSEALVDAAQSNLYGHLATVTEEQVKQTVELIKNKSSNAEYRYARSENVGVQHFLKREFHSDYQAMIAMRDALQEVAFADEGELAQLKQLQPALVRAARDGERMAFGDTAVVTPPRSSKMLLDKSGVMEREWFQRKADEMAALLN